MLSHESQNRKIALDFILTPIIISLGLKCNRYNFKLLKCDTLAVVCCGVFERRITAQLSQNIAAPSSPYSPQSPEKYPTAIRAPSRSTTPNTLRVKAETDNLQIDIHRQSSGEITWREFAQEIFEVSKLNIKVLPVTSLEFGSKAKRPIYSKLNCERVVNEFGIELKDWKLGLTECLKIRQL